MSTTTTWGASVDLAYAANSVASMRLAFNPVVRSTSNRRSSTDSTAICSTLLPRLADQPDHLSEGRWPDVPSSLDLRTRNRHQPADQIVCRPAAAARQVTLGREGCLWIDVGAAAARPLDKEPEHIDYFDDPCGAVRTACRVVLRVKQCQRNDPFRSGITWTAARTLGTWRLPDVADVVADPVLERHEL